MYRVLKTMPVKSCALVTGPFVCHDLCLILFCFCFVLSYYRHCGYNFPSLPRIKFFSLQFFFRVCKIHVCFWINYHSLLFLINQTTTIPFRNSKRMEYVSCSHYTRICSIVAWMKKCCLHLYFRQVSCLWVLGVGAIHCHSRYAPNTGVQRCKWWHLVVLLVPPLVMLLASERGHAADFDSCLPQSGTDC